MTITMEELRRRIKDLDAIPSIPAIIQPLAALLALPPERVKMDEVLKLVSCDSTMTAQCLRMANSPLFGRRRTETVRSAVLALGLKRMEAILLSCSLNRLVPANKWALDAVTFWRHAMGCALVSQKIAKLIGYPDPEKAYLAGLLHDLGILVNTLVCTEPFRECLRSATERNMELDQAEREHLGFTHCQSGKILAEQWRFPADIVEAIAFHHDIRLASNAVALVSLVHLSDLLCRLRELGYGYYEAVAVDLQDDSAWAVLLEQCPNLASMDVARLTMDIDGAMEEIAAVVDAVFKPQHSAASAS